MDASSIGAVGLADEFVVLHRSGGRRGDGLDLSVGGGVFAQFDLTRSLNLINADYVLSVPLTWRRSQLSGRIRFYHQSSHVGDAFATPFNTEGINLTYEALEALLSIDNGPWRLYAGSEALLRREPTTLGSVTVHSGAEVRSNRNRPVAVLAGIDLRLSDGEDRGLDVSARAGIEIDRANGGSVPIERILLLAELYDGHSPFGSVFVGPVRYAGIGMHILH